MKLYMIGQQKVTFKHRWLFNRRGRRSRDSMMVGFITAYAISAYHHQRCEFESRSGDVYSIQHYVMKLAGRWFSPGTPGSPGTPVSSTNKIDHHDIAEILL